MGEAHQPKTGVVLEDIGSASTSLVERLVETQRRRGRYGPIRRRHDDPRRSSSAGLVGLRGLGRDVADDRWCGILELRRGVGRSDGHLGRGDCRGR